MNFMDVVDLFKAKKKKPEPPPEPTKQEIKSAQGDAWQLDPLDLTTQLDESAGGQYHRGTLGLDFGTLRSMARTPVVASVIQTRCNQVAEFAEPQRDQFSLGFRINIRDSEEDYEPSKEEKREMAEIMRMIEECGPRELTEDDFETFLRKITRDSLTFDQGCFEVLRARNGKPVAMEAVDASTIRRAKVSEEERKSGRLDMNGPAYVQVIDVRKVGEWTRKEMGFLVRRPRTWLRVRRYGFPELEEMIRTLTFYMSAIENNGNRYIHGMHSSGILAFKSKMNPRLFRAFKREFESLLMGARNAHKNVLVQLDPDNKEEIQQVNLSQSNVDAQYEQWVAFLIKLICSIYQMDPAELGFVYGNEGQTNTLNNQNPEQRVKFSREKGLRPLLRTLEREINRTVLWSYDPWKKYHFKFCGFDAEDPQTRLDKDVKKLTNFMTVNEIRAQYNLKPLDGDASNVGPLNANFVQLYNALQQEQMMGEEGEEEGFEGEGGGEMPEGEPMEEGGGDEFDYSQFFKGIGLDHPLSKALDTICKNATAKPRTFEGES